MTLTEYIADLNTLNESELFYKSYYEAKKDPKTLKTFLENMDIARCRRNNYILPDLPETMPPSMQDEYIITLQDKGIVIQKHNCYSPVFTHFHTYFECIYVYRGTCTHTFGGKEMLLKEGDFAIIPPNVSHSIGVFDKSIILNLILSQDVIVNTFKNSSYFKDNDLSRFFINSISYRTNSAMFFVHTYQDEEIQRLILMMGLESKNKFPEAESVLQGSFSILFGLLLRYYRNNISVIGENLYRSEKANKMVIYIQDHHADVTLTSLAQEFGYTKEYVSKYIKDNTGKSFLDILMESRLKHAVVLLETTAMPLESIALQIGYQNVENFMRTFKKVYGTTPTNYRKIASLGKS